MHYNDIKIPKDKDKLIGCYIYLSSCLRSLWIDYVTYAEEKNGPSDPDMYKIMFNEMDFLEGLRQRVADRLPPKLISNLRKIDDYNSW